MADTTKYRWDGPRADWDTTQFLRHGDATISRTAPADQRVIELTDDDAEDLKKTQKLVKADGSDSQSESAQREGVGDSSSDKGSEQQVPGAAGTAGPGASGSRRGGGSAGQS